MRTVSGGRHTAADAVRARTGLLLVAAALVLSGCASAPDPVPSESPSAAEPVFASDEEALAAATEAYAAYQVMSSAIAQQGGEDPNRMKEFATGQALEAELESFTGLADLGLRGLGELRFDSMTIQELDSDGGTLTAYLCLDVSNTDVVDSNGASRVPADRVDRLPLEVHFIHSDGRSRLLVERSESWLGENFC